MSTNIQWTDTTWNPTTGPTPARRKMRRNYRTKDGGDVTDRYRRQLMALGARDFDAKQSSFGIEGQGR